MPTITLTVPGIINISLQKKEQVVQTGDQTQAMDIVYFARMNNGVQIGDVIRLGECVDIQPCANCTGDSQDEPGTILSIFIEDTVQVETPLDGDYIFFVKETKVGMSGLNGYYAKVKMNNNSEEKIELFSVGSEVAISSK